MRSSLNFLLSAFSVSVNLHLCYLEVLMRPASFSKPMLVNLCSNTEQTYLPVLANKWLTFHTDDSIHGFSGWFKLKSPSSVLILKGFFSTPSPEVLSQHHFSNHTNRSDFFFFNSCAFCHYATSSKELYGVSWNFWAWGALDAFCKYNSKVWFLSLKSPEPFNSGKNEL